MIALIFRRRKSLSTFTKEELELSNDRKYYVIDTNILIDYPDIVSPFDGPAVELDSPTIDLTGAHLIIPSAVIRELSSFKKEKSERGSVARLLLKRLNRLRRKGEKVTRAGGVPKEYTASYNLDSAVKIKQRKQLLSIMPITKDFTKEEGIFFSPSSDDMDGQIILTALIAATKIDCDQSIQSGLDKLTILTNDNDLSIRADIRGITTSGYGYKYPEPYTGRREVTVPKDLLSFFLKTHALGLEEWERYMSNQPALVANEFIIMHSDEPIDGYDPKEDQYFSNIGRYDAREHAIVQLKHLYEFPVAPRNPGQAIYAEALAEPSISAIVCTGPAGSGKTYMATAYGYEACKRNDYIEITVVPCEDRGNTGALPGDLEEKMDPSIRAIKDALMVYLMDTDKDIRKGMSKIGKGEPKKEEEVFYVPYEEEPEEDSLKNKLEDRVENIWKNWFSSIPVDKARGRTFPYRIAFYDEFQDQNARQADTLIKRIGKNGKMIITGDVEQVHVPWLDQSHNGLVYASRLLENDPEVAQVHFTEEEVVRHPLVKRIAERQAAQKRQFRGE